MPFRKALCHLKTYEEWFNHMDEYKDQLKEQSALREAEKRRRQPDDYAQLQRSGI